MSGFDDTHYALALMGEAQPGWDGNEEVGASTATAPAPAPGVSDPGGIERYGPHFVPFVTERFRAVEILLGKLLDANSSRAREGFRVVASGQSGADGPLDIPILTAQPNQKYVLHRMYVHAEGYTFVAPYTNAAAWLGIRVDGADWDGISLVSGGAGAGSLPIIFTQGRLSGLEVQDGETLSLHIVTPPASTRIEVRCSGVLSWISNTLG